MKSRNDRQCMVKPKSYEIESGTLIKQNQRKFSNLIAGDYVDY